MKNFVCLLLCLSLGGFTIARAADPGSELTATAKKAINRIASSA